MAIYRFGYLVGSSQTMRDVYAKIEKAAHVAMPVLIVGETGTGKEIVAQELHRRSNRAEGPFVPVNMGTLSGDLMLSELFGHVRGAFTDARENKDGCFEEARGGTLFLDEIGTMTDRVQVALLRVLEQGTFRPVGGKKEFHTDVRIVAASNEDLDSLTANGAFREDLLYRLRVFCIAMPPLRARREDIPMLAEAAIAAFNSDYDFAIAGIEKEAFERLAQYPWPGNVREFHNVLSQAALLAEKEYIGLEHLPQRILDQTRHVEPAMAHGASPDPAHAESAASTRTPVRVHDTAAADGLFMPVGCTLDEMMREYARLTLAHCGNNKTRAAKLLGVSRKTLYERLNRWHGPGGAGQ
ncbi:MAG: sigma-54 interaction domain-containing protein [Candidatus Hydrogenedentota bacterium]